MALLNLTPDARLPIDSLKRDFMVALEATHVVVEAPTGSGKSTRLPVWCAEQDRALVVEPRRLACRAQARHVAGERPARYLKGRRLTAEGQMHAVTVCYTEERATIRRVCVTLQ